jgi:hypothetical protein
MRDVRGSGRAMEIGNQMHEEGAIESLNGISCKEWVSFDIYDICTLSEKLSVDNFRLSNGEIVNEDASKIVM